MELLVETSIALKAIVNNIILMGALPVLSKGGSFCNLQGRFL